MEAITIVLLVLCAIMLGIIVWLICSKWSHMTPEGKNQLVDKGMLLIQYLKTAWSNDGKIDLAELEQVMKYLIEIISYLAGTSVSSVKMQTGTEDIIKNE